MFRNRRDQVNEKEKMCEKSWVCHDLNVFIFFSKIKKYVYIFLCSIYFLIYILIWLLLGFRTSCMYLFLRNISSLNTSNHIIFHYCHLSLFFVGGTMIWIFYFSCLFDLFMGTSLLLHTFLLFGIVVYLTYSVSD